MLVLSRGRDQVIRIGDDIEIVVVEVRNDSVRLGIRAPSNVSVHRQEIYDLIKQQEDKEAGKDAAQDAEQGCRGLE